MGEERITSRQNPLLRHVKKLLASHAYRNECGEYVGDGTKLLAEAARWDAGLRVVIAADGVTLCPLPPEARLVRVPPDVMDSVSQMQTPQGALFVCAMPPKRPLELQGGCLILDGIQDPGNLGTILRRAARTLTGRKPCGRPWAPSSGRRRSGRPARSWWRSAGRRESRWLPQP